MQCLPAPNTGPFDFTMTWWVPTSDYTPGAELIQTTLKVFLDRIECFPDKTPLFRVGSRTL